VSANANRRLANAALKQEAVRWKQQGQGQQPVLQQRRSAALARFYEKHDPVKTKYVGHFMGKLGWDQVCVRVPV
jgi:hypothetical protein